MSGKTQTHQPSRVREMWEQLVRDHLRANDDQEWEFIDRLPEDNHGTKDEFVRLPYAAPRRSEECLW